MSERKNTAPILVTGSAGFIGFHMARKLLEGGHKVIGLDAMTDYYDISLKEKRHAILEERENFTPIIARLEDGETLDRLFRTHRPEIVIHLAAQAGVRYSIDAPESYVASNIEGSFRLLEAIRAHPVRHLLFASTSSVYGANEKMPFEESDKADHQLSFYGATKKACEAMAHSYSHLYDIPTTMFRFFTVYGPWGRPDMALFKFTDAMLKGEPIDVYNHGKLSRDFTYIDDIISPLELLMEKPPSIGDESPAARFRVVNLGNSAPTKLLDFISALEEVLARKARMNMLPMQSGDVFHSFADTARLRELTGYEARTDLKSGIRNFVDWYLEHYRDGEASLGAAS